MYRNMIINFLWEGKRPKIRYEMLIQDHSKLGLKLVDLEIKDMALKAAWPVRWKECDGQCCDISQTLAYSTE